MPHARAAGPWAARSPAARVRRRDPCPDRAGGPAWGSEQGRRWGRPRCRAGDLPVWWSWPSGTRPPGSAGPRDRLTDVKAYRCRVCDHPLHFENSVCVSCGTNLGYSRQERAIVPVDEDGRYVDASGLVWHVCRNLNLHGCTWLAPLAGGQCFSCDLTRTRPSDEDVVGLENYPAAERAKRHLIADLDTLGFRVVGKDPETGGDPENGLAFDLLSSVAENVVIGHEDGVITIALAESDAAYREQVKQKLAEPYRTMLGHFRHEVGHYYEWQLVRGDERMARCRELFGDESKDYQEEIQRHYDEGAPAGWEERYISTYATMHPFEDFAETWAHYLHICDTVET